MEKVGVYDWLVGFEAIEAPLKRHFGIASEKLPVCIVGCGTSLLSEKLASAEWWPTGRRVVSVDYDHGVVTHMALRNEIIPDRNSAAVLDWAWADFSLDLDAPARGEEEAAAALLAAGCYGGVVDKGTFDAMVCEGLGGDASAAADGPQGTSASASAALFVNAARLLAPSGAYFLVSLHPPRLLARLVACSSQLLGMDGNLRAVVVVRTGPAGDGSSEQTEFDWPSGHEAGGETCPTSFDHLPDSLAPGCMSVLVTTRGNKSWQILTGAAGTSEGVVGSVAIRAAVEEAHAAVLDAWFQVTNEFLDIVV